MSVFRVSDVEETGMDTDFLDQRHSPVGVGHGLLLLLKKLNELLFSEGERLSHHVDAFLPRRRLLLCPVDHVRVEEVQMLVILPRALVIIVFRLPFLLSISKKEILVHL